MEGFDVRYSFMVVREILSADRRNAPPLAKYSCTSEHLHVNHTENDLAWILSTHRPQEQLQIGNSLGAGPVFVSFFPP